jgi:cyclic lactone autoinducer peptide
MKKNRAKAFNAVIAKIALVVTKANINSTCPYTLYQPKLPESAKQLRKF